MAEELSPDRTARATLMGEPLLGWWRCRKCHRLGGFTWAVHHLFHRHDRLAMRILARQVACPHAGAVPVDTLDGERVAWLCPDCDKPLPAGHGKEALTDA